jgi:hypothetical protein
MNENGNTLSQEAIDALLESQPDQEEEGEPSASSAGPEVATATDGPVSPETEEKRAPTDTSEQPEADIADDADETLATVQAASAPATPLTINVPPPPGAVTPPGVVHAGPTTSTAAASSYTGAPGLDKDEVVMIASEAAESAVAPLQEGLSAVSGRIGALEEALKKIVALEKQVVALKGQVSTTSGGLTLEDLRPLVDRLLKLEHGTRHTPAFNVYEKFTCSSCQAHGAVQVRTRCSSCGSEGWLGRKEPGVNGRAA